MLMSPIRLEQSLLVDTFELFLRYGSGSGVLVKPQNLRCHSGGMYRIHCLEHGQNTYVILRVMDLRTATDSIFQPYFPLKKAQRAGHWFTLILIEQNFR